MTRMGFGMICIKYLLFASNLTFLILSVVLISVGASLLTVYKDFEHFLESTHLKPAEILIAAGAIVLLVSLVGCIGALKESTMLVNVYGLLLFLLFILEISAGIAAVVLRCTILDDIKTNMKATLEEYTTSTQFRQAWDFAQERLRCCGVENPADWAPLHLDGLVVVTANETYTVPFSCCDNAIDINAEVYNRGCLSLLESYVSDSSLLILYVAIGVATVQALGVVMAVILAKAIRRFKTLDELERQGNLHRIFQQIIGDRQVRNSNAAGTAANS